MTGKDARTGVSSGKSNPLSSLALKAHEQVRKQGGGELPQQFSAKSGEAVKEGERERECDRKVRTGTDGETQGFYIYSHLKQVLYIAKLSTHHLI